MLLRERYTYYGAQAMSDAETLAIIIGTGCSTSSAYGVALTLMHAFGGLRGIAKREAKELEVIPGIGAVKALQIHAALQLSKRLLYTDNLATEAIRHPEQAASILSPRLRGLAQEELHGLYLDRAHRVIATRTLSQGTESSTLMDPKLVFRPALALRASAVILAHNHPSGECAPSARDRKTTERLEAAGDLIGTTLLDHLVIGRVSSYSIQQNCEFPHAP
jgi:DNA repair protein RadC